MDTGTDPGSKGLARPAAALRSASKSHHSSNASAAVPALLSRLALAAVRIDAGQRGGVDNGNLALDVRDDRRDFARIFLAGAVVVRPDLHAAGRRAASNRYCAAAATAARCRRDPSGKMRAAASADFSPSQIIDRRVRGVGELVEVVERPRGGPMLRAPAVAFNQHNGRKSLRPSALVVAADKERGFAARVLVGPNRIGSTPKQARRRGVGGLGVGGRQRRLDGIAARPRAHRLAPPLLVLRASEGEKSRPSARRGPRLRSRACGRATAPPRLATRRRDRRQG